MIGLNTSLDHLYPSMKVEKSILSTEGDRQVGSLTEQRHRIWQVKFDTIPKSV